MDSQEQARELMEGFLDRTVRSAGGGRYLWTDAYAVLNLLRLGERAAAEDLVERVHHTLGRHREDEPRQGWLSGAGESHPTLGGLRIGKPLPERQPHEPLDSDLEWERDGQYFHYLTRWANALLVASRQLDRGDYRQWARDLMITAHRRFVYQSADGPRMYWKMSIDLSRPLVASMGHHDPLDGLATCLDIGGLPEAVLADFRAIVDAQPDLATSDLLGIGGLLSTEARLRVRGLEAPLRERLIEAAVRGLRYARRELGGPAERRLAFRELGLAIGLRGNTDARIEPSRPLADEVVASWLRPEHKAAASWREHRDINEVMLASALLAEPDYPF